MLTRVAGPAAASRRPELDSLRAVAILGVLYSHFVNEESWLGTLGVDLFFVLSGYLITGILLRGRAVIEAGGATLPATLKTFYIRRALRIVPVYYFCLIVLLLAGNSEVRSQFWWHATFNSNVLFVRRPFTAITAHFWTLAVEEQFYLIWPVLVLGTPASKLPALLLTVIALGPVYRLGGLVAGWPVNALGILMPGCVDVLAIGALLAYADTDPRWRSRLLWGGLCSAPVPLVLAGVSFSYASYLYLGGRTLCGLAFAALIATALGGAPIVTAVLRLRPLVTVGIISYGAYVFHLGAGRLAAELLPRLGVASGFNRGPTLFVAGTMVTLVIAAASWTWYEKPINSLKDRWPYRAVRVSPAEITQ